MKLKHSEKLFAVLGRPCFSSFPPGFIPGEQEGPRENQSCRRRYQRRGYSTDVAANSLAIGYLLDTNSLGDLTYHPPTDVREECQHREAEADAREESE